jgi:hypothetical protein
MKSISFSIALERGRNFKYHLNRSIRADVATYRYNVAFGSLHMQQLYGSDHLRDDQWMIQNCAAKINTTVFSLYLFESYFNLRNIRLVKIFNYFSHYSQYFILLAVIAIDLIDIQLRQVWKVDQLAEISVGPPSQVNVLVSECHASGMHVCKEGLAGNKKTTPRLACVFWAT